MQSTLRLTWRCILLKLKSSAAYHLLHNPAGVRTSVHRDVECWSTSAPHRSRPASWPHSTCVRREQRHPTCVDSTDPVSMSCIRQRSRSQMFLPTITVHAYRLLYRIRGTSYIWPTCCLIDRFWSTQPAFPAGESRRLALHAYLLSHHAMGPAQPAFPEERSRRYGLHAYCCLWPTWLQLVLFACSLRASI